MEIGLDAVAVLKASEIVVLTFKPTRMVVHGLNEEREEFGQYHHLFTKLKTQSPMVLRTDKDRNGLVLID